MKKIKEGEPFDLNGTIYQYNIQPDGNIALKRLKMAPKRIKTEFVPPTLADVTSFFTLHLYANEAASKFYDYYSINNWKDGQDKPVKNWKQKAIAVWFKPEYKLESPKGGGMVM